MDQRKQGLLVVEPHGDKAARAYSGFDGTPLADVELSEITLVDGLADLTQLLSVRRYLLTRPATARCLYISMGGPASVQTDVKFTQLGIDLGWYESEFSSFSAILHEMIFGRIRALVSFAEDFNEHSLFANDSRLESYLRVRRKMRSEGADLERMASADPYPVEIYALAS